MKRPQLTDLNPLRCRLEGTDPEVVLVAKLSWLLVLCGGFPGYAGTLHVPAFGWVVALGDLPGDGWFLAALFIASGLALLTNQFTRSASIVAGLCVILAPMQSIAAWHSHMWVAGAFLVLAGLHPPGERPWLLRAQATLCLLVILFDRPGAVDWSAHVTLEGWQTEREGAAAMQFIRDLVPAAWSGYFANWLIPVFAMAVACGIWIPPIRAHAIWTGCAFFLGGALFAGTDEAALFTVAVLIGWLSFLDWPRRSVAVHWPRACGWPMWLRIALDRYDFDRQIEWPFPEDPDADLDVWIDGRHLRHRKAISALLLYTPSFHGAVFGLVMLMALALPQPWATAAHACIGGWLLVFFALPTFVRVSRRWRRRG